MIGFLLFLLTLYLLYKAIPRLLAWWLRRQQARFGQRMSDAQARSGGGRTTSGGRVHYDEIVSEDAEYEEIAGPREQVVEEAFVAEEQIVDAEFEDI